MIRAIVRPDGSVLLGPDAERLGFVAGAVVEISRTSAGSLLLVLDDTPPLDLPFTPLEGGAAQLALGSRLPRGPLPPRRRRREPLLHSGVTDVLPDDHPLAWTSLDCSRCGQPIHAANNECMQPWVESGKGMYCLTCFVELFADDDELDGPWGLPEP